MQTTLLQSAKQSCGRRCDLSRPSPKSSSPRQHSTGGKERLGGISKQGNRASSAVPIVFALVDDPVGMGLVASLARHRTVLSGDLAGKRLALLREVVPGLRRLAIMANVEYPNAASEMREVQIAARTTLAKFSNYPELWAAR